MTRRTQRSSRSNRWLSHLSQSRRATRTCCGRDPGNICLSLVNTLQCSLFIGQDIIENEDPLRVPSTRRCSSHSIHSSRRTRTRTFWWTLSWWVAWPSGSYLARRTRCRVQLQNLLYVDGMQGVLQHIQVINWYRWITWPKYSPLIGQYWTTQNRADVRGKDSSLDWKQLDYAYLISHFRYNADWGLVSACYTLMIRDRDLRGEESVRQCRRAGSVFRRKLGLKGSIKHQTQTHYDRNFSQC